MVACSDWQQREEQEQPAVTVTCGDQHRLTIATKDKLSAAAF